MTCWFFHDWSRWLDKRHGPVTIRDYYKPDNVIAQGWYIEQQRECRACGKKQIREVRTA